MIDDSDLLQVFVLEMLEHLETLDQILLQLESAPDPAGPVKELFRMLHTIKGGASLFGFKRLSSLTHRAENLVSELRNGTIKVHPELLGTLFEFGDTLRARFAELQARGREPESDDADLIQRLEALADGAVDPAFRPEAAVSGNAAPAADAKPESPLRPGIRAADASAPEPPEGPIEPVAPGKAVPLRRPVAQGPGTLVIGPAKVSSEALELRPGLTRLESLLHVDVHLLNRLLDRSSELLLLRHAFFAIRDTLTPGQQRDYQLLCQRYQGLAMELQESLMQVRMQPVGQLWKTYPRLLRELSLRTGKQLRLHTEGEDTELDKAILEAIRDPLTHLLRNAVDHGLEPPEQREAAGKPAQGNLWLRAFQDEGYIFIEIADDGCGLDWEGIRRTARERGLLSEAAAAAAGRQELLQLLFQPGFSTARQVTDLSGRGVGMDVVMANLALIGGTLEVFSEPGQGACFRMRLPLTLTLLPALLLRQGDQLLALPQHHIKEILVRDEVEALSLGDRPYCRWRGQTLALGNLAPLLGQSQGEAGYLIVLQGQHRFALAVDDVLEIQELAIKPLSAHWERFPLLTGASLLGSGELALILSLTALEAAIVTPEAVAETGRELDGPMPGELPAEDALLLFKDLDSALLALPLPEVAALDEAPLDERRLLPARDLISRRGELIPVLDVAAALAGRPPARGSHEDVLPLVICQRSGRKIGLLVSEVLDIVANVPAATGPALRPGMLGTLELGLGTAELLDASYLWGTLAHG